MKSLCITGAPSASCAAVAQILYDAGLAPARPLQHGSLVDMQIWHQRVVPLLTSGQPLGRLWERTAEELLLANLSEEAWGWHEAESVWALDYWADLDPGIHFLLLCEPPEQTLADALLEEEEAPDVSGVLEYWRARHGRMLDFYLDHPERCLLVDVAQARSSAAALVEGINDRWQLLPAGCRLTNRPAERPAEAPVLELARAVAGAWCQGQLMSVETLRQELEAAQLPLNGTLVEPGGPSGPEALFGPLRLFQQLLNEQALIEIERQASAQSKAEVIRLRSDLDEQAAAFESLIAEKSRLTEQLLLAQQDLETRRQEADDLNRKLEDALHNAASRAAAEEHRLALQQECERLLLSLHETQEQLETSIAQRQGELAAHGTEREKLKSELERARAEATLPADAQADHQALQDECERLLISLRESQKKLEQALAQRQTDLAAFEAERRDLANALEDAK